ncbi:ribosomal protein L28 [Achlya hypogyna]|uniref:Ribosomal protein L28 n=1 Tax=Achlya hypogyna TaxID=1202772 RepID=A0A1V9YM43_ACHHY|nr:ribosomal protein L28 [Achlya hypogyna]
MSNDTLTWLLTKNNNAFLVKGVQPNSDFSRASFNLLNRHCRKYDALSAQKAVGIALKDKKVTLTTKIAKNVHTPAKAVHSVPLNKGFRANAHTIRAEISRNFYRGDLKRAALARWTQLNRVAKIEKGVLKKSVIKTKRNQFKA